jgi:D-alanyl-lipoteichoic acid acyltransferase DltB (MBOAT superfamily)
VLLVYQFLPKVRVWTLLIASYFFYGWWSWSYLPLLAFSTFVAYFFGIKISKSIEDRQKKNYLLVGVLINFGLLFYFKYFNFANAQVDAFFKALGMNYLIPYSSFLLPMGISFFSFQAVAYLVDVYRGEVVAEKKWQNFAMFKAFFPQLVAGPIERAKNLIPQLKVLDGITLQNFVSGLGRFMLGMVKKVVISNRLALFVGQIYDHPQDYDGFLISIATLFFAFQIYCDFSGYSDMAIGVAKMFGVDLMENFKSPYLSRDIRDFWSRWHISLSTWFKDYLYIPLGGNRKRFYLNLLIVFVVSGLWHGASWNFLIWGGLHGVLIVLFSYADTKFSFKINRWISTIITFICVNFAWLFFRSSNWENTKVLLCNIKRINILYIKDVLYQIKSVLFDVRNLSNPLNLDYGRINFQISIGDFVLSLGFIFGLMIYERFWSDLFVKFELNQNTTYVKIFALFSMILLFGVFSGTQFIYFQF